MANIFEASPVVKAIDLIRVNIDRLALQDLEIHAAAVLETISALSAYINDASSKTRDEFLYARRLNRRLCLHMARVRALLQAGQSGYTNAVVVPTLSMPAPSRAPAMGRWSRVIRSLPSADNAVVGPVVPSNLIAQRADLEGQRGSRSENNKAAAVSSAGPRSVANPSR